MMADFSENYYLSQHHFSTQHSGKSAVYMLNLVQFWDVTAEQIMQDSNGETLHFPPVSGNKIHVKCHLWKKKNNYSYDVQFASTSSEIIKER